MKSRCWTPWLTLSFAPLCCTAKKRSTCRRGKPSATRGNPAGLCLIRTKVPPEPRWLACFKFQAVNGSLPPLRQQVSCAAVAAPNRARVNSYTCGCCSSDIFQPGVTRPHHCSSPIPGSFVQVALHPRLRFQPYAYGIRISGTAEGRKDIVLPRSWAVEASLDGREGTWDVLSRQKDNTIFESAYEVAIFPIESVERRKPAVVENAASRSAETAGAPPSNEKENGGDVRGELARMREGIYVGDIGQVPPPEHLPGFYRFFRFRMNGPGQVVGGSADTADSAWSFHLGRVELFGNLCVFDATVGRYIHLASASVQ